MQRFPVMVAAGGINSAGRTSGRHAYRRIIRDDLPEPERLHTDSALMVMMGTDDLPCVLDHTLVREIEPEWFDYRAVPWHRKANLRNDQGEVSFEYVPGGVGDGSIRDGRIRTTENKRVHVTLNSEAEVMLPSLREFEVSSAGQLPSGFRPGELYPSRNHPRALQMTIYAMSDALADLGIEWSDVISCVPADAISVYVSSAMGQLDEAGSGGMLRSRLQGRKVTSKLCPLGFAQMPGDFISSYVLRTLSVTGPALGACATFLYNLRLGAEDIRSGRSRVAVVGAAEAPVNPEVMDGYIAMGALATDKGLRELDGLAKEIRPDNRRACRPFGENCGFTMAESAQVVILMDDALALEMGATILAGVPFVSVRADGAKKSISGPGAGNYLTVAETVAQLRGILGDHRLRHAGLVQAHGTGTPQNRVSESTILSRVAGAFGIKEWPVAAIKSYLGHSLAAAAGDQLTATLGIWQYGVIPRIQTIGQLAEDVVADHLAFALSQQDGSGSDYAIINSKGFGGNNATAALLSPNVMRALIEKAHGKSVFKAWQQRNDKVLSRQEETESRRLRGDWVPTYYFDEGVLTDEDIILSDSEIKMGSHNIALHSDIPENWTLK